MNNNYQFILEQFNKRQININIDWLKSINLNNFAKYYELFLNTEINLTCLPNEESVSSNNLTSVKKTTLFEKGAVLQLIDIIDASKSLFQQVEQLKGIEDINEAAELNLDITQKKVNKHNFKLTLSDGKNEFLGFEYEMINDLKLDISLGTKIEIKNVNTIRGMMMLTPKNCKVLGGHVPSLNTIHPILRFQRKLRGPDYRDKPYVEKSYTMRSTPQNSTMNTTFGGTSTQPNNNTSNNSYMTDPSLLSTFSLPSVNNTTIISNSDNNITNATTAASGSGGGDPFDEFDDTFIDMIADQYEETENNAQPSTSSTTKLTTSSTKNPTTNSTKNSTKDPFDEFDDSFINRLADEYDDSKHVINLADDDDYDFYEDDLDDDAFVDS